jgi:hypothetical protein
MFSATAYVIRDARVEDVPELVRLGWATEEDWPTGQILVGEIHGVVAAALAIDENRSRARRVCSPTCAPAPPASSPTGAPRRSPSASASGCAPPFASAPEIFRPRALHVSADADCHRAV